MPRILHTLRTAAGMLAKWVALNFARLFFWVLLTAAAFGAAMGLATYALVRGQSPTCQIVAGLICGLGVVLVALIAGAALAVTKTLENWVAATNLGPMVSQALFAQTLGVSDKRPEGKTELAKSLQGATVGEVRRRLKAAFAEVFATKSLDRWLPASGRWLASRVVNTAGSLAARAAIDHLPGAPADETPIDLLRLRDQMGDEIERRATGFVTLRARLTALAVLIAGGVIILLLVLVVSRLLM